MSEQKKIDLYGLLTKDELENVTNIFLEAFSREYDSAPELFELETNIIIDN
tara:strand:- start:755 stop:907 length:153 start_codon:yes stop_codon:yes gene_type:complete